MDQAIPAIVHPAVQVILEGEGKSWSAYAPGLPGCMALLMAFPDEACSPALAAPRPGSSIALISLRRGYVHPSASTSLLVVVAWRTLNRS